MLLCYNLCRSLSASQFVSNFCLIPALYDKIPAFYADISIFSSTVLVTYVTGSPYSVSGMYTMIARMHCVDEGGGCGHIGGKTICTSVRTKLFWCAIYCAKLIFSRNPKSYMGITRFALPQNNGNLPIPLFGGNYPIVFLNNIYS